MSPEEMVIFAQGNASGEGNKVDGGASMFGLGGVCGPIG